MSHKFLSESESATHTNINKLAMIHAGRWIIKYLGSCIRTVTITTKPYCITNGISEKWDNSDHLDKNRSWLIYIDIDDIAC